MCKTRNAKVMNVKKDSIIELFAKIYDQLLPTDKSIPYALTYIDELIHFILGRMNEMS